MSENKYKEHLEKLDDTQLYALGEGLQWAWYELNESFSVSLQDVLPVWGEVELMRDAVIDILNERDV